MCGNCHDSTCAVAHHYIVGYVDRYLLACDGVDGCQSLDLHACLVLDKLCSLELALLCTLCLVIVQCCDISDAVAVLLDNGVLGCDYHESNTVECVGTGGVDAELLVLLLYLEINECACGLAYPVLLLELYVGQIVYGLKSLKELVGVLGDTEVPYLLGLLNDIAVAYVTLAAL